MRKKRDKIFFTVQEILFFSPKTLRNILKEEKLSNKTKIILEATILLSLSIMTKNMMKSQIPPSKIIKLMTKRIKTLN